MNIRVSRPAVGVPRVDASVVVGVLEPDAVESAKDKGAGAKHERLWENQLVDLDVEPLESHARGDVVYARRNAEDDAEDEAFVYVLQALWLVFLYYDSMAVLVF